MTKTAMLRILMFVLACRAAAVALGAETVHKTYFENTDYELHVYEIIGRESGPTMMIIGGIQGDEPGSYLAADIYADISLRKGNLIVVPRANFYAILLNHRGPNGDMNRKFAGTPAEDYDSRIVAILKELISHSDVLLNLHDGSGFYRHEYIDALHNPMRFGQCIIADADVYVSPTTGKRIELGAMARRICEVVNRSIPEPQYKFHFNNHNTVSDKSPHLEQRRSATYYSLTRQEIPAFGVESSKEIPSNEVRMRHKVLVINAFMDEFGIVAENPRILLEKPRLNHLIVLINGLERVALKDGETLMLNPGDRIVIEHLDMNYTRGLSADIIGHGGVNDLGVPFTISHPTRIVVRKDSYRCATVNVAVGAPAAVAAIGPARTSRVLDLAEQKPSLVLVNLLVDGVSREVARGEAIEVRKGSILELTDPALDKPYDEKGLVVNFKGFVGDTENNTGEDRGYRIRTDRGLMPRFSTDGKGVEYPIEVSYNGAGLGSVFVRLVDRPAATPAVAPPAPIRATVSAQGPPRLVSVNLLVDGEPREVAPDRAVEVNKGAVLELTDPSLDKPYDEKGLVVNFKGFVGDTVNNTGEDRGYKIRTDRGLMPRFSRDGKGVEYPIEVSYNRAVLGTVHVRLLDRTAATPPATVTAQGPPRLVSVNLLVDGEPREVAPDRVIEVKKGSVLELTDPSLDKPYDEKGLVVNFKGFVGDTENNTGEDRGYKILTDRGLMPRFSRDGKGVEYPIEVSYNRAVLGTVYVRLVEPTASAR